MGRFRCRFWCQLIIDSWLPVHDPRGSGSGGYLFTIHDLKFLPCTKCGATMNFRITV